MHSRAARQFGVLVAITVLVLGAAVTGHTGHAWAPKRTTASDGGPESMDAAVVTLALGGSDGGPE